MTDDQRLEAIDRRGSDAAAAVLDAIDHVEPPAPEVGEPSRRRFQRSVVVGVAAGLVVVALVGAAVWLDRDDEQATVAGLPETGQPGTDDYAHFVLSDPQSLGYHIVGASDGTTSGPDIPAMVQSPVGAEDPWEEAIVTYSVRVPSGEEMPLDGEPVDIPGAEEAVLVTDTSPATVSVRWVEGNTGRSATTTDFTGQELVEVVRNAVAAGVPEGSAFPGFQVVHTGGLVDMIPISGFGARESYVRYRASDEEGGGLTVATTGGSEASWRAPYVLVDEIETATVRGREAIRTEFDAEFDLHLYHVSWLEPDGTIVRITSREKITNAVLDGLESVDDDVFAALVEEHGTGAPGPGEEATATSEVVEESVHSPRTGSTDGRGAQTLIDVLSTDHGFTFPPTAVADAARRPSVEPEELAAIAAYVERLAERMGRPTTDIPHDVQVDVMQNSLTVVGSYRSATAHATLVHLGRASPVDDWSQDRAVLYPGAELAREGGGGLPSVWVRRTDAAATGRTVVAVEVHGEDGLVGVLAEVEAGNEPTFADPKEAISIYSRVMGP